ncbi:hypothetical protein E2562_037200 [Oryza meyeriana var. granulata]|uniref:Uncharacterized protein n=1 Tax=Oryza meyeriana var. granulata TaxID=110450 RepID=A0A6G1DBQ5_9ORYZ|nr:hypothetical protein E2562_037200 [Oryza meyeriana var. granulata]
MDSASRTGLASSPSRRPLPPQATMGWRYHWHQDQATALQRLKLAAFASIRGKGASSLPSRDGDVVKGLTGIGTGAGDGDEVKDAAAITEQTKEEGPLKKMTNATAAAVEKFKEVLVRLLLGVAVLIESVKRIMQGSASSRAHVAVAVFWSRILTIWFGDCSLMPWVASAHKVAVAWNRLVKF